MSLWLERMNELAHYQDLLRDAKQERLARQGLEGQKKNLRFYCKMMSWLGSHLSALGKTLQERYGDDYQSSYQILGSSE